MDPNTNQQPSQSPIPTPVQNPIPAPKQYQPAPIQSPPPSNNNSGIRSKLPLLLIVVLLILVLALGGGWFLSAQNTNMTPSPTPTPEETEEIVEETSEESFDETDGQTYTNSKYGISFQYPINWSLIESTAGELPGLYPTENPQNDGNATPIGIMHYDNPDELSLEEWDADLASKQPIGPNLYDASAQETMINGRTAYTVQKANCQPFTCKRIVIMEGDSIFVISYLNDIVSYQPTELADNENAFNEIVASIKFN